MNGFLEQKDGFNDLSLGDESSLIFRDEVQEVGSQDFGYDFI